MADIEQTMRLMHIALNNIQDRYIPRIFVNESRSEFLHSTIAQVRDILDKRRREYMQDLQRSEARTV